MKTEKNKVVAALTGSIATGKTVVLDYFRDNLGFKVVSADAIGHEVLKNPEIIKKIAAAFGENVIKNGLIDRNALYFISGALILICWAATYLAGKNIVVLTIAQAFFQAGVILFSNIIFRSIPDAVDWGEWKYGVRAPGMVSASISFFQKLGMGVATFIVTAALTLVGYQEGSLAQTAEAAAGIRAIYPLIPSIFIILSLIGFFIINSVKKEELVQMRKELDEKRGRTFDEKNAIV